MAEVDLGGYPEDPLSQLWQSLQRDPSRARMGGYDPMNPNWRYGQGGGRQPMTSGVTRGAPYGNQSPLATQPERGVTLNDTSQAGPGGARDPVGGFRPGMNEGRPPMPQPGFNPLSMLGGAAGQLAKVAGLPAAAVTSYFGSTGPADAHEAPDWATPPGAPGVIQPRTGPTPPPAAAYPPRSSYGPNVGFHGGQPAGQDRPPPSLQARVIAGRMAPYPPQPPLAGPGRPGGANDPGPHPSPFAQAIAGRMAGAPYPQQPPIAGRTSPIRGDYDSTVTGGGQPAGQDGMSGPSPTEVGSGLLSSNPWQDVPLGGDIGNPALTNPLSDSPLSSSFPTGLPQPPARPGGGQIHVQPPRRPKAAAPAKKKASAVPAVVPPTVDLGGSYAPMSGNARGGASPIGAAEFRKYTDPKDPRIFRGPLG